MTDTAGEATSESSLLGDHLDWSSEMVDVTLSVELPFWLMVDDCDLQLSISDASIQVSLRDSYVELHAGEVLNSRRSLAWRGPKDKDPLLAPHLIEMLEEHGATIRPCRSVVKIGARAHGDVFHAFAAQGEEDVAIARGNEASIYLTSLCDAHIPVLNDLIQRYRLATYDYFPYEVAPWDVPVWQVSAPAGTATISLLPYSKWDQKPPLPDHAEVSGPDAEEASFRFTDPATVSATDPTQATPGEFELLDARSMMERGDYTGAVRRSVTAIEAVVEHALRAELRNIHSVDEAESRLEKTKNDFPGRYRQWKKLANVDINDHVYATFETTRDIRHQIVHRALRLTHADRDKAQMSVDNARWLFNAIERRPDRTALREKPFVLRDVGRVATFARFDVIADKTGIRVQQPSQ